MIWLALTTLVRECAIAARNDSELHVTEHQILTVRFSVFREFCNGTQLGLSGTQTDVDYRPTRCLTCQGSNYNRPVTIVPTQYIYYTLHILTSSNCKDVRHGAVFSAGTIRASSIDPPLDTNESLSTFDTRYSLPTGLHVDVMCCRHAFRSWSGQEGSE